ncbi:MAG: hypothetical protein O7C01_05180 [Actinobacteria bacterium]|nr:hypothetical protein [Actinomycetota bacterium]
MTLAIARTAPQFGGAEVGLVGLTGGCDEFRDEVIASSYSGADHSDEPL